MFRSDPSWQHRRCLWIDCAGHRRALFAFWHPEDLMWHCQISGYGMEPRLFLAACQSHVLTRAVLIVALWSHGWRLVQRMSALYVPWDGVADLPALIPPGGYQLDLFRTSAPPPAREGVKPAQPATPSGGLPDLYVPVTRKVSLKNETRTLEPGAIS